MLFQSNLLLTSGNLNCLRTGLLKTGHHTGHIPISSAYMSEKIRKRTIQVARSGSVPTSSKTKYLFLIGMFCCGWVIVKQSS